MKLEDLIKTVREAGVVGAGGAGFPTHVKLKAKIDTVILNCAECEPLLKVDRQLMTEYCGEILSTMELICQCLECRGIIAVKSVYKSALEAVKSEIADFKRLELKILPNVYPAGDEIVLIYEVTGRIVQEGALPSSVGTVVLNVETVLNIHNAVDYNKPVTHKYVTVAGEVRKPVTLRVPIGMKSAELIELAGGTTVDNYEIIMGGPMTGRICSPYEAVTKTTKALLVLPENHPVVVKKKANPSISLKRAMSACSQCSLCTELCPRNLLGHSIRPHRVMNGLASGLVSKVEDYVSTLLCSECGLCEMYSCHQGLSPRTLISEVKKGLRKNGVTVPAKEVQCKVSELQQARMVPMERLVARLGLRDYLTEARLDDNTVNTKKVEINLLQHIGAKAVPIVEKGETVECGQVIAVIPGEKLGAQLHASLSGTIENIKENSLVIAAESRGGGING